MAAYSKWKILITKTVSGGEGSVGYAAISELRAYANAAGTGPNLFVSGSASAITTNGSYLPANAFDGSESTTWESGSATAAAKWLRYDLPAPVEIRSIYLSHTSWNGELPDNFTVQASNDGTEWSDITRVEGFKAKTSATGGQLAWGMRVGGSSRLDTGQRSVGVYIHSWPTGILRAKVVPDAAGDWVFYPWIEEDVLVTHIGPSGYRPLSDGPVTPYKDW